MIVLEQRRVSEYSMEALGTFNKVRLSMTGIYFILILFLSQKHRLNQRNVIQKLNKFEKNQCFCK